MYFMVAETPVRAIYRKVLFLCFSIIKKKSAYHIEWNEDIHKTSWEKWKQADDGKHKVVYTFTSNKIDEWETKKN